uniref:Putative ovule protein n=1 Tax=Solanum chacoense TaxID=4108 RepID=A0A0V0GMR9_SOLCH
MQITNKTIRRCKILRSVSNRKQMQLSTSSNKSFSTNDSGDILCNTEFVFDSKKKRLSSKVASIQQQP